MVSIGFLDGLCNGKSMNCMGNMGKWKDDVKGKFVLKGKFEQVPLLMWS